MQKLLVMVIHTIRTLQQLGLLVKQSQVYQVEQQQQYILVQLKLLVT